MTDKEIIKALDILDKFDFFQGQRAGRELWNDKPFDVQNKDIENFSKDVAFLKDFINRQKAEIEMLLDETNRQKGEIKRLNAKIESLYKEIVRIALMTEETNKKEMVGDV